MNRERADPFPSPSLSAQDLSFPFLQGLTLEDKERTKEIEGVNEAFDDVRTVYSRSFRTKTIGKEYELRKNLQK